MTPFRSIEGEPASMSSRNGVPRVSILVLTAVLLGFARAQAGDSFQTPGAFGEPRRVKTLRIGPDGSVKGRTTGDPTAPPPGQSESVSCGPYHSLEAVMDDGRVVTLEDGSIWQVSDGGMKDAAHWAGGEGVIVCGEKLVNIDKHATVEVRRIK